MVEARIRDNGGHPAFFSAEEVNKLRELAGEEYMHYKATHDTILGSTGMQLLRAAKKRIAENVAKELTK